jgi:hypothetical protein
MSESTTERVALYGRTADDLTRCVLPGEAIDAVLTATGQWALRKDDGYFVFANLPPSVSGYEVAVSARSYQARSLTVSLPTTAAVPITYPGEDELFVAVTTVDSGTRRVSFDRIPFLPRIAAGARVRGIGGFTATLSETLEGSDVDFATLSSVAGLAAGGLLRFVRSERLVLAPGPYYPFDPTTTLVSLKVVENGPDALPLGNAAIAIDEVNGKAITTTAVQGAHLHRVALSASSSLLLGTDRAIRTRTNERGDAVLYFPANTPITALRLQLHRAGFHPSTQTLTVAPGNRVRATFVLNRV